MDRDGDTPSIEERLREVARSRAIAVALLHGAAAAEVEDVLQEASLAALAADAPRGRRFVAWLRGAVRHLARTTLRRRVRRAAHEERAAAPLAQPSAAELAHRLSRHRELLAAVEQLSEPIRVVIVRRYLDEVPPRVIAKELGVPVATVKTRLRRGLAQLRERLTREWGEEAGVALVALAHGGNAATGVGAGALLMGVKVKAAFALAAALVVVASIVLVATRSASSRKRSDGGVRDSDESVAAKPAPASVVPSRDPASSRNEPPAETRSLRERLGSERVVDLEGVVVDEHGRPVAGANVSLRSLLFESIGIALRVDDPTTVPAPRTATSDGDGSFHFPDVVRGELVELDAEFTDGRCGRVARVRAAADEGTTITLHAALEFRGVVVDAHDDRPVAGAVVRRIRSRGAARDTDATLSDGDGAFTLRDLDDRSPILVAHASDGRVSGFCIPEQSRGPGGEIRIQVGRAQWCRGTVVDAATGLPIAGATVGLAPWGAQIAVRSKSDGTFRIAADAAFERNEIPALVTAPGYVPANATLHCSDDPEIAVRIELKRGGVARGRVVARSGSPLRNAALVATHDASKPDRASDRVLAISAADGSFELSGFDPSVRHLLLVRHEECEQAVVPFPPEADGAADVDLGTICVGRGALISGVVTDESGAAIGGAQVGLEAGGNAQRSIECDSKGRFEFAGVSAGRVHLTASAASRGFTRIAEASLEVDDEVVMATTLVLPTGLTITGRVVDPAGGGVAGCEVVLEQPRVHVCQRVGETQTDADGHFCFRGLQPASLDLAVNPRRSGESRLIARRLTSVVVGAPELTIALEEGGFVSGCVVDGGHLPIAKASVTARDATGAVLGTTRTADDGTFRLLVARGVDLTIDARLHDILTELIGAQKNRTNAIATRSHVQADDSPLEFILERN